jgi:hypothetical protein
MLSALGCLSLSAAVQLYEKFKSSATTRLTDGKGANKAAGIEPDTDGLSKQRLRRTS